MNQTVLVNLMIVFVVTIGLVLTQNPLFILGLFFMNNLPYGLVKQDQDGDEEDDPQPMGFTQDVK